MAWADLNHFVYQILSVVAAAKVGVSVLKAVSRSKKAQVI